MDDAVVVGIDSLEGEPGLVAIEAAVQQLLQGREGEVAVIHGLVVDPHLPAHEGLALRGKGRGIGQDVLLVRIGGDHVASTDDVLVLVHELEVDNAVVVGVDSLEGEPGLLTGEAAVQQLGEGVEGELAVIHGLAVDPDLPAHEGLTGGGKGCGIGQVVLLIGVGGDHVAAADDVLVLVHELEVDDTVVVGKDGLEGQPGLILVEVLAVLLHECIERIVGELALIHGGIPKTHLPAHKGLALGGEAGGSRGLKLDAGGGGDDIAAAQGHVLAVHIVHKGHMDGVVHSALTVQADHEGIRDNPLDVVVIQHNGHGGAVHTGVSLRIGVIRRHIGGGIEPDVVVITLDAQTVARHRVAAIQQAGGDGLVALGGAVHLQVPQKGLQLGIRGGDSADGDRDNIVINHQVALFRQLITLGDPAGINVGGLHAVGVGSHSHGVAVADCLTGCLVHEADRDVSRDALEDRGDGNEALGPIPDDMLKHIGQSRGRRQYAAVLTVVAPAGEGVAGRGGDALKGVETGFRLGEGFMIEHLTGGLGQISLGGIRNVVVDGDGAVLLDKDRKLIIFGSGRISIILRKHVSRGRGEFAQRHGLLVGGNGHTLGAALHFQAGLLIHKHDGEGQRGGLVDGIDIHGSEGIAVFVCSPVVGIGVSSKGRVVKCVYSALPINLPTGELHTDGGGLISLIDGRPQRRPGRISRGHSTLAEFHNTSAHLGGILENNVDGRDLLRPCSGISLAVGYFFFQRGTPAGEVPAVTVQFSGKAGGKVAEQEVLVFLILEHIAAYTVLVGHGVRVLKHIGGAVARAAVGVIAPDGVDYCTVVGGDINSIDCGRRGIGLAVDRIGIGTRPADKDNGLPVHSIMGGFQGITQRIVLGISNGDIHGLGILTIDLAAVGIIGQLVRIGDRLLVGQGHSDIVSLVLQSPLGRAGHALDIISSSITALNFRVYFGNLGREARVAGQPQPLGSRSRRIAHPGVLHRQGGGAEGGLGHRERNGAAVLAVLSTVVQGSVPVQGDSKLARRLGVVLDLDLIGQGDALILLQALIVRPGNDVAIYLGGGAAFGDGDIPHQFHIFAQRVADQAKDVPADLLEAVGKIFGVIGRIIMLLVSSQLLEILALVSKADSIDLAVLLEGIGLLSGPDGDVMPPKTADPLLVTGLTVGQDDHDAVVCAVLQHVSALLDASAQRGAVTRKILIPLNSGNRRVFLGGFVIIHDIMAINIVAQALYHGLQSVQGDFPTALCPAIIYPGTSGPIQNIIIVLMVRPFGIVLRAIQHRPGTVDHEHHVGLLGLDVLLVGSSGQGDLIGVIRARHKFCGLVQGDIRILPPRVLAVDCIILVSWP